VEESRTFGRDGRIARRDAFCSEKETVATMDQGIVDIKLGPMPPSCRGLDGIDARLDAILRRGAAASKGGDGQTAAD
jgi:hypothetical protein